MQHEKIERVQDNGLGFAEALKEMNDGSPASSSATTLPSITVSLGRSATPITTAGKRRLKSLWLRDQSCVVRPDLRAIARNPSSFSS
jgi:hypothetical protein